MTCGFSRLFFSFLIVCFLLPVSAITQDANTNLWAVKLSEYRMHLLTRNPDAVHELKYLLGQWKTEGRDATERGKIDFANHILLRAIAHEESYQTVSRKIKSGKINGYVVEDQLSEKAYNIIVKNGELLNLILKGYLKINYPYAIDPKTDFFKECLWYDIKEGEVIGEIGAGLGIFSLMFHRIYPDHLLHINELRSDKLTYLDMQLKGNPEFFNADKFSLVQGKEWSTGFEDNSMDKIIMHNVFHHFTDKYKMTRAIHSSLKDNGILLLKEEVRDLNEYGFHCFHAMYASKILSIIKNRGFELLEVVKLDGQMLFKFKKINDTAYPVLARKSKILLDLGKDYDIRTIQYQEDDEEVSRNELRFYTVESDEDCKHLMYNWYGSWSYEEALSDSDGNFQYVWENIQLFDEDKYYTVYAKSEESQSKYYSSFIVVDENGKDCLSENYENRQYIIELLVDGISRLERRFDKKNKSKK